MEEIINKILLKDKIEFQGPIEKLKMKLNESKGRKYNVEWISASEFKFLSKWTIGTLIVNGMPGLVDGIKGYGKIEEKEIV